MSARQIHREEAIPRWMDLQLDDLPCGTEDSNCRRNGLGPEM